MKVSTKGRYALRLMIDIAVNSNDKPVSIKEIARRQGISENTSNRLFNSQFRRLCPQYKRRPGRIYSP